MQHKHKQKHKYITHAKHKQNKYLVNKAELKVGYRVSQVYMVDILMMKILKLDINNIVYQ